jgi:hypothetical protein
MVMVMAFRARAVAQADARATGAVAESGRCPLPD